MINNIEHSQLKGCMMAGKIDCQKSLLLSRRHITEMKIFLICLRGETFVKNSHMQRILTSI